MRISDWSSDVCSSDLPAAGVPGPEGQIVPAMQPGAALSGTSAARPTLAEQARRSTLIAYGGRDLGREAGAPTAAGAAGEAPDNAAGAPESGEGRAPNALDLLRQSSSIGEARASMLPNSEEHTSELQSLMRISYAV